MNDKMTYVLLIAIGVALIVFGIKKKETIYIIIGGFIVGIFIGQFYVSTHKERN